LSQAECGGSTDIFAERDPIRFCREPRKANLGRALNGDLESGSRDGIKYR
jgi:hypothetical protein